MRIGEALGAISRQREIVRAAQLAKSFSPRQFVTVQSGSGQPVRSDFDAIKAIKEGSKKNAWVGAIVMMLCKYGSDVRWTVFERRNPKDPWVENEDHDDAILLEYPNPKQSRQFLMWFQLHWLMTAGDVKWKLVQEGRFRELWALHPVKTRALPHPTEWISGYKDTAAGGKTIPANEVIHAMIPNPENPLVGLSPLQSLWGTIQTDNEAATWNFNSLKSGGVKTGIIQDENIRDPVALAEFQQSVDQTFGAGSGSKLAAMGYGGKYIPMATTAVEMEWISGRKFNLNQFCAGLGVLPALFDPDSAIYSNLKIAERHAWTSGVLPLLGLFRDAFNTALVGTDPKARRTRWISYDVSGVAALRSELAEKITTFAQMVQNGIPINDALAELEIGIEPIEGGDKPLVQAGLIPLADAIAGAPDPRTIPDENL